MIRILAADILSAFKASTIGTKVTDSEGFLAAATPVIQAFDFAAQRQPGQGYIPCNEVAPFVSAGVGKRTKDAGDYILREHRGNVEPFLRRELAAPVEGVALIVYTRDAYLADPDVMKDQTETDRVIGSEATHIIVAVLGFAGPKAPLSPYRLAHNLAGGNKEALQWSADEIRAKAAESKAYWDVWATVAD